MKKYREEWCSMKRFITILIMLILFGITGCGSGADYSSEEAEKKLKECKRNV